MSLIGSWKDKVLGILEKPKDYLYKVAIRKALVRAGMALAAILGAKSINDYGIAISVDPDALAAGLMGLLEMARNYLKQKYPKSGVLL